MMVFITRIANLLRNYEAQSMVQYILSYDRVNSIKKYVGFEKANSWLEKLLTIKAAVIDDFTVPTIR